ncbi:hypothetical protein E2C01_083644 [Portunus trituberculatus]|uniref:Uncharacterized protein n=1 Tax=Portunus trituberculatus TaxID=210409 RepID=A0A5B7J1T5_PORTR|nr:hypothetical protein [Portunus trituberculatus]
MKMIAKRSLGRLNFRVGLCSLTRTADLNRGGRLNHNTRAVLRKHRGWEEGIKKTGKEEKEEVEEQEQVKKQEHASLIQSNEN